MEMLALAVLLACPHRGRSVPLLQTTAIGPPDVDNRKVLNLVVHSMSERIRGLTWSWLYARVFRSEISGPSLNHIRLACLQAIQKNTASPRPIRAFLPSTSSRIFSLTASFQAESPSMPSVFCEPLHVRRGVSSWIFSGFQPLS